MFHLQTLLMLVVPLRILLQMNVEASVRGTAAAANDAGLWHNHTHLCCVG